MNEKITSPSNSDLNSKDKSKFKIVLETNLHYYRDNIDLTEENKNKLIVNIPKFTEIKNNNQFMKLYKGNYFFEKEEVVKKV